MKIFKVFSLLLLSLVLLVPVSWGEESSVADPPQAADPKGAGQAPGAEAGDDEESSAETGKDPQDEPVNQTDLQGIRSEIETLRDQWQRTLDKKTAQTSRSLKFAGTVQTRYTQPDNGNGAKSSFDVPALILSFKGNLKRDYEEGKNVDYSFSVNRNSDFSIKPLDAWISYSILPSNDLEKPYLYITVGQQKKPISAESLATEEFKPTIRGAQFASALKLDERDIGVVIKGDLFPHVDYGFKYRAAALEYSLGVINGTGPNKVDDNNYKDIVGRIVLNAPVDYNHILRGLSLGASYYWGTATPTANRITTTKSNFTPSSGGAPVAITTSTTTTPFTQRGDRNRWGVDLSYVNTPIGFTLEYVRGKDASLTDEKINITNGTTTRTASKFRHLQSEGYTFTLFYNFGEQFVKAFKNQDRYDDWYPLTYQPFIRFDRFDPDLDTPSNRTDIWTIGFNWFFAETTKLQLNYNIKTGQTTTHQVNEFLAQFQYGF